MFSILGEENVDKKKNQFFVGDEVLVFGYQIGTLTEFNLKNQMWTIKINEKIIEAKINDIELAYSKILDTKINELKKFFFLQNVSVFEIGP